MRTKSVERVKPFDALRILSVLGEIPCLSNYSKGKSTSALLVMEKRMIFSCRVDEGNLVHAIVRLLIAGGAEVSARDACLYGESRGNLAFSGSKAEEHHLVVSILREGAGNRCLFL